MLGDQPGVVNGKLARGELSALKEFRRGAVSARPQLFGDLPRAPLLLKKLASGFFCAAFSLGSARRIEQDRVNQVWGANQALLVERNELQQRAVRC